MDLVVDANILFAALITNNKTAELLFEDMFHLYAPEYLLDEFEEHREEIVKKSKRPDEDFDRFLKIVKKRISFYPYEDFKKKMKKARKLTSDPDDTEYVALALSIGAEIWSNDKKLKDIEGIKVLSTMDLVDQIKE